MSGDDVEMSMLLSDVLDRFTTDDDIELLRTYTEAVMITTLLSKRRFHTETVREREKRELKREQGIANHEQHMNITREGQKNKKMKRQEEISENLMKIRDMRKQIDDFKKADPFVVFGLLK